MKKVYGSVLVVIILFLVFFFSFVPSSLAVDPTTPFRYASWSDAQDYSTFNLGYTSNGIATLNPNFTIFNGDFSDDGVILTENSSGTSMQQMTKQMMGNLTSSGIADNGIFGKTFFVRGNHDNHYSNPADWQSFFTSNSLGQGTMQARVNRIGGRNYTFMTGYDNLTYSFDYGNSRFIMVDVPGSVSNLTSSSITWMNGRLDNAESDTSIQHVFIHFHSPIYCTNYHCSCTLANDSACVGSSATSVYTSINNHPKVSATFHGHEHVLGWTHMDRARVSNLNVGRTYEQFMTSPSEADNYIPYSKPARMSYEETSVSKGVQGFGLIDVDGLSFKVRMYRLTKSDYVNGGKEVPLTCKQLISCTKDPVTGSTSCVNTSDCGSSATPFPTPTVTPAATPTPRPSSTPIVTTPPTPTPPSVPTATPVPGSVRVITFDPSTDVFINPERGFFNSVSLTGTSTYSSTRLNGFSMLYANTRLDNYISSDLPTTLLTSLDNGFARVRQAKLKVILRFSYNDGIGYPDATQEWMTRHMAQLKPILEKNKDVIYSVYAGFVGAWGEWWDSPNFNTGTDGNGADYSTLLSVYTNIQNMTPSNLMTNLRYPAFRKGFFPSEITSSTAFNGSQLSRTGFHNDCFLSDTTDQGTYNVTGMSVSSVKDYFARETRYVPMVGETCDTGRVSCTNALSELALMHWTALNYDYYPGAISLLKTGGCYDEILSRLGYRFQLNKVTIPSMIAPGSSMSFRAEITNTGYAPMYNYRPVNLVFENKSTGNKTVVPLNGADPRRWLPQKDVSVNTLDLSVSIPSNLEVGTYKLYLWLPDQSTSLQSIPEYSVRLANANVIWNSTTGYNLIADDVTVSTSQATPNPTPIPDANGDGVVNELDYNIWLLNYNQITSGGVSKGDFDLNGKVDGIDYVIWLTY